MLLSEGLCLQPLLLYSLVNLNLILRPTICCTLGLWYLQTLTFFLPLFQMMELLNLQIYLLKPSVSIFLFLSLQILLRTPQFWLVPPVWWTPADL